MKLMRFKWKFLLASILLANNIACSNDDLTQVNGRQEQTEVTRTADWFTQTVILETAGTLEAKLTEAMGDTDLTTLEKLVVSGPFTLEDLLFIRDSLNLVSLDMKDAVIKASDEDFLHGHYHDFLDNTICGCMFSGRTTLEEIILPTSIEKIEESAFAFCRSLKSIVIPDGVKFIGHDAFKCCSSLASVTLSANLEELEDNVFYQCDSLKSIVIPDGVTKIGNSVFKECRSLASVVLPTSLERIEYDTFRRCDSLKSVIIPEGVKVISDCAFYECRSMALAILPNSLETIGSAAFYDCRALENIVIPTGVKRIEDRTFYQCSFDTIVLPENLEYLGNEAFRYCTNLSSIKIPGGVKEIGDYCFDGCNSMAEIILSEGIEKIGVCSFYGCHLVTSVDIPTTLRTISSHAFFNCQSLQKFIVPETVTSVEYNFVGYCHNLRALVWNPTIDVPYCDFNEKNTILFVFTDQIGVNINDWKAIVINGVSDSTINFSVNWNQNYANVQEFKAKKLTFTRYFGDETIPGGSSGWQTIVLPFTPDSIYHETKGQIAPFNSGIEGAKPFWLRELTSEGFRDVTKIEANKPYIIAMPNHGDYLDEYCLNGTITFVARDSLLRVTPETLPTSIGPEYELHSTYKYIKGSDEVYALCSEWNYYEEENMHYYKSFFRKNSSYVSAFNAYVTPLGGGRSSRKLFDLDTRSKETRAVWSPNKTGIPQIGDM